MNKIDIVTQIDIVKQIEQWMTSTSYSHPDAMATMQTSSPGPQNGNPIPPNVNSGNGSLGHAGGSYRSYNPSPAPAPSNPVSNGTFQPSSTFQPITNPGGNITGHYVYSGGGNSSLQGLTPNGIIVDDLINRVPKDDIVYIIVRRDGTCLEHMLDNPITPRETIGMCMFINAAQMSIQGEVEFDWENLIATLQIGRHFVEGHDDHTLYEEDTNVLYIKLF